MANLMLAASHSLAEQVRKHFDERHAHFWLWESDRFTEIRAAREASWNGLKSRTHTIHDFYTALDTTDQYVMIGSIELLLIEGKTMKMRFCVKLDVQKSDTGEVKIASYVAFAVGVLFGS